MIEAWNKIDAVDEEARERLHGEAARRDDVVLLSALTGNGVDRLQRTLSEALSQGSRLRTISVPSRDGAAIAWLHAHGEVVDQEQGDEAVRITVRLSDADWARFQTRSEFHSS